MREGVKAVGALRDFPGSVAPGRTDENIQDEEAEHASKNTGQTRTSHKCPGTSGARRKLGEDTQVRLRAPRSDRKERGGLWGQTPHELAAE